MILVISKKKHLDLRKMSITAILLDSIELTSFMLSVKLLQELNVHRFTKAGYIYIFRANVLKYVFFYKLDRFSEVIIAPLNPLHHN